jgi:TfoX/Sxy family transcriptional regulator of competence genes
MVYNEALAARIRSSLGPDPHVEEKKMFGGLTFMVDGQMCCGVLKDDLIVKVDPASDAVAQPGARPFDFSGRPMAGMVYVAASALEGDAALRTWLDRGLAYLREHPKAANPAKAPRSRKARGAPGS